MSELAKKKYINILFLLLLFLVYKPSPTEILGASLGLKFGDIILFAITISILFYNFKIVIPKNTTFIILTAIMLVDMVSILKSLFSGTLIVEDSFELFRPVLYLFLYTAVYKLVNSESFNLKVMRMMYRGYMFYIVFSFIQLINLFDIKSFMAYFYEVSKSRTMDTSESIWRLAGTFTNPNYFGMFLVIVACFIFTLFLAKKNKFRYGTMLIATVSLIMFTGSRTSIISLIVSLISVLLILIFDLNRNKKNKRVLTIVLFTTVTIVIVLFKLIPTIYNNFQRFSDIENIFLNFYTRYLAWDSALEMWKVNPLLGNGPYKSYMDSFDNNYVLILYRSGLVGLTVFLSLFVNCFRKSLKLIKLTSKNDVKIFGISMIGVTTSILIGMVAAVPYNFIQIGSIFILLVAIQDKLYALEKKDVVL